MSILFEPTIFESKYNTSGINSKKHEQYCRNYSADERQEALAKLEVAANNFLLILPFFGFLLTRQKLVDASKWVPTAGVDGRHFYYNVGFINDLTIPEIQFLLCHELLHLIYGHLLRANYPNGLPRIHKLYNIAADYNVNADSLSALTINSREPKLPDGCYYKREYANYSTEEIYEILLKEIMDKLKAQKEKEKKEWEEQQKKQQEEQSQSGNQDQDDNESGDSAEQGSDEEQDMNGENPENGDCEGDSDKENQENGDFDGEGNGDESDDMDSDGSGSNSPANNGSNGEEQDQNNNGQGQDDPNKEYNGEGETKEEFNDEITNEDIEKAIDDMFPNGSFDDHFDLSGQAEDTGSNNGDESKEDENGNFVAGSAPDLSQGAIDRKMEEFKGDLIIAKDTMGTSSGDSAGTLPEGVLRVIQELEEPVFNWRKFVKKHVLGLKKQQISWTTPKRRGFDSKFILPGKKPEKIYKLHIALDTSGSIQEWELRDFLSEVYGAARQLKNVEITIWTFDTEIYNVQTFTKRDIHKIVEYKIFGNGGTDFMQNFRFMQEEGIKPDLFIMFTDGGYFGEPGIKGYCDTLYVIHDDHARHTDIDPAYGKTIFYKKDSKTKRNS
tara:strand:- start:31501 stop:33336 length:1836 start_codon:yes stop_codon:yes gene_type:complete